MLFRSIANIDYLEDELIRIFVVINSALVNDTTIIRQIICELKKSYPLDNNSYISFFSDKKYANYKDELFFNERKSLPESEYRNWLDSYYLGEFEFDTLTFKTFPVSNFMDRQKTYKIKSCL